MIGGLIAGLRCKRRAEAMRGRRWAGISTSGIVFGGNESRTWDWLYGCRALARVPTGASGHRVAEPSRPVKDLVDGRYSMAECGMLKAIFRTAWEGLAW